MAKMESDDPGVSTLRALLREAECGEDTAQPLAEALGWPVACDAACWSAEVLTKTSAILQERARRVWRRQMSKVLLAAFTTLPLWLFAGAYAIGMAYEVLCGILPTVVATYLVSSYAVVATGVVGATYAMIPVVIGRSRDRLAFAQAWEVSR